jgi:acyl carrier protein
MSETDSIRAQLKRLIIESLNLEDMTPEMIGDESPLIGDDGLGLDSVDALELVVAMEKKFGLRIEGQERLREAFASVAGLAAFVAEMMAEKTSTAG